MGLTPVALMEGMAVAKTLFLGEPTEEEAVDKYGEVLVFTSSFRPMRNTISGSESKSFMKIIVDKASDLVVGVHMVGPDSAEIMQGLAVAVKMGATKADFDRTIGIHPTAAEEFVTMRSPTREVV